MPDVNLSPISPYPYTAEQQALLRRRQLAQLLQEQAMAPVEEPSVRGANVNVLQGIAKMVQALMAGRANRQLDTQQQGLNARIQTERSRQATEMARAMMPQAQGTTANLPMAPTQAMPVPSTLTPQDAAAQQLPGSAPYTPPMPAPVTPEGSRSLPIPASSQSIGQMQAFARALASPDPTQQEYAKAQMADIFAGQRTARQEGFESFQKALDRGLEQQKITNAQANYLSEAAHRTAQEKIAQELEQKPKPMILPEGGQMMMVGPEGQMTPGPMGQPKPPASIGSYTNDKNQHVQILRMPDESLKEVTLGTVREPDQNVVIRTVNAQGQPVQKIVPKKPGAEYAAAPTAQETNRRDQAIIVNNYADHILQLIDQNPTAVGPILGRIARGEVAIGNVPDNVKTLHTALGSFEALQPILHGFRGGSQTVDHFKTVIGDQHLNAAALKASINEIKTLAKTIDPGIGQQPAAGGLPAIGGTFNGGKVLKVTPVP